MSEESPSRFLFICNGQDADTFNVAHFEGTDAISSPYRFNITVTSSLPDLFCDDFINNQATLFLKRKDEYYPYSGIITDFEYVDTSVDFSTYSIVLQPRLSLLGLTSQSRIFQKTTVPDIIESVLKDAGLTSYYTLDVQSYPEREYIVQYQESDFNFINRLMEECGIWYFFTEDPVSADSVQNASTFEAMTITDKSNNFSDIATESAIKYRSENGMVNIIDDEEKESITVMGMKRHLIPQEVTVKNYNYRTPETDLSMSKSVSDGDTGSMYRFGGEFKDTDGAQSKAELLIKQYISRKFDVTAKNNCSGFRAGFKYSVEEHVRDSLNTSYLITTVSHSGANPSVDNTTRKKHYHNHAQCIPAELSNSFAPVQKTPLPKMPGIMTALIETEDSDYAALDDKGRYKIRLPFDRSDTENSKGSKYMRLAQPYSGADYGIHFPSHEGTEMIIGHIDGDPNRPLGLGTIPNANTISPVKDTNKTQSVIRTAGGNEMIFDDNDGKQKVTLKTNNDYRAAFDDENKCIEIQTADSNTMLLDDGNKKVVINAGDNSISMSYGSSKGIDITSVDGHSMSLSDSGKMISIRTKSGNEITMSDSGKSLTITDCEGKNTVTLDGKGLSLESSEEITIKAEKDLKIQAKNILMKSDKEVACSASDQIQLESGSAKTQLKKNGDIKLKGNKINIKGSGNLTLKGSKVAQN